MPRGGGVAVRRTVGTHPGQAVVTDLISGAGHSQWLHQTPIEGPGSLTWWSEELGTPQSPRPINSSVPLFRSSRYSGLGRQTLLVSARLGEGAATRHLVMEHQEDERESSSNHRLRLGALCPEGLIQSLP